MIVLRHTGREGEIELELSCDSGVNCEKSPKPRKVIYYLPLLGKNIIQ